MVGIPAKLAAPAQALYYKEDGHVAADVELQAWWTEIRTKGHPDADPSGWPAACQDGIKTVADLSDITTTMAWMGSAHHAAGALSQFVAWPLSLSLHCLRLREGCRWTVYG
jgi:hypothetical protein